VSSAIQKDHQHGCHRCGVRTPYWVGYIVQRPESHCIHHQEGMHAYNFSDLPLWDILFGSFRNPRRGQARCGFGPSAPPLRYAQAYGDGCG